MMPPHGGHGGASSGPMPPSPSRLNPLAQPWSAPFMSSAPRDQGAQYVQPPTTCGSVHVKYVLYYRDKRSRQEIIELQAGKVNRRDYGMAGLLRNF